MIQYIAHEFEELIHINKEAYSQNSNKTYFNTNMRFGYNVVRDDQKKATYINKNYFNNKLMNRLKTIYIIGVNDEPIMLDLIFKHKDKETQVFMSYYGTKDLKIKEEIKKKHKGLMLLDCKEIEWIDTSKQV